MSAEWAYGSMFLAVSFLVLAFSLTQWIANRSFSIAHRWCDDHLLSVVEIKKISRNAKNQLSFNGMRASILEKGINQHLFEVRVYDHDMHRERTGILKVTSSFSCSKSCSKISICRPQWHDEGIDLIIKKPKIIKSRRQSINLDVA